MCLQKLVQDIKIENIFFLYIQKYEFLKVDSPVYKRVKLGNSFILFLI